MKVRKARKSRRKRMELKKKHLFNSSFEEKNTLEYLSNLIDSRFLNKNPGKIFKFTNKALGMNIIIPLLEKHHSEIVINEDSIEWIRSEHMSAGCIPDRILVKFLSNTIAPLLKKRLNQYPSNLNDDIEKRLKIIRETFKLAKDEVKILTFFYLVEIIELVDGYLGTSGTLINLSHISNFRSHGHNILGVNRKSFLHALSKRSLLKACIIESSNRELELTDWYSDYLSGLVNSDLSLEFFTKENNESLQITDFNICENEMMVLDSLIKSKKQQNILFYGVAGTGKSSFARCLARTYKKELYTVKIPETDDHKDRLRAIYATTSLADKNKTIVLIDEADEILNSYKSFFFESKTNKSWINNLLESHQKKVIWITNRASEIDSSTMRRFTFSIEFKKFSIKDRLRVLSREIKRRGLNGYFDDEVLHDLCKTYSVNAGGIIDAINILKIGRKTRKETALKKIRTLLRNHEKVTGGKNNYYSKSSELKDYSLKGLNTSQNLENVVSALRQYTEYQDRESKNHNSIKILLYGMPGTGKSEFVYYLGNLLNKEVLLKRCSDIQSMWVGETEKNIAGAFNEAQGDNSILFFDEADSFLYPRKDAHHSWEKNFTNEILTQIDSYKGIVVFATNEIDGLDHAAFRRFQFKIEFLSLTSEGNIQFYNNILRPLVLNDNDLSEKEINRIQSIEDLTPGDFVVVKEQNIFTNQSAITHQRLIESLTNETKHKESKKMLVGFASKR